MFPGRIRPLSLIAIVFIASSCSSTATPKVAANPERGLRNLRDADAEVSEIAVEAAQSLRNTGSARPSFAGVFVEDRKSRLASDAVVRATGFIATDGRAPARPECRAVNQSTGASTPIPCPPAAATVVPPTYTFAAVRATADSAYVGASYRTTGPGEESCIVLVRRSGRWTVLRTDIVADARRCGQ